MLKYPYKFPDGGGEWMLRCEAFWARILMLVLGHAFTALFLFESSNMISMNSELIFTESFSYS